MLGTRHKLRVPRTLTFGASDSLRASCASRAISAYSPVASTAVRWRQSKHDKRLSTSTTKRRGTEQCASRVPAKAGFALSVMSVPFSGLCWPVSFVVPPDALRASGGIAALTSFATCPFGAKRASEQVASPTFGWPSQAAPARLEQSW